MPPVCYWDKSKIILIAILQPTKQQHESTKLALVSLYQIGEIATKTQARKDNPAISRH